MSFIGIFRLHLYNVIIHCFFCLMNACKIMGVSYGIGNTGLRLFDIDIERLVDFVRYILSVFLSLADTFGQKVFDLPVDRSEIILRPGGNVVVQFLRQPQRNLLLFCHKRLIQTAGIDDRLCVPVAAEHNQKIGNHRGLAFLIELNRAALDAIFTQTFSSDFDEREAQSAYETIKSGWISTGPKNAELEQMFIDMWKVKHAVSMSNCTDALHVCCMVCGFGPGDEVIIFAPAFRGTEPFVSKIVTTAFPISFLDSGIQASSCTTRISTSD